MTTNTETPTTTSTSPTHIAYHVRGKKGEKGFFTRLGAAWPCKNGFNIQLDAVPVDGRITLLLASEKKE